MQVRNRKQKGGGGWRGRKKRMTRKRKNSIKACQLGLYKMLASWLCKRSASGEEKKNQFENTSCFVVLKTATNRQILSTRLQILQDSFFPSCTVLIPHFHGTNSSSSHPSSKSLMVFYSLLASHKTQKKICEDVLISWHFPISYIRNTTTHISCTLSTWNQSTEGQKMLHSIATMNSDIPSPQNLYYSLPGK